MSECACNIPNGGYCARHNMRKTPHLVHLCKQRAEYWERWERKRSEPSASASRPPQQYGPGTTLRRMLGCSAKRWPHYNQMDLWGAKCISHIAYLSKSLVEFGHANTRNVAERLVRSAVARSNCTPDQTKNRKFIDKTTESMV